MPDDARLRHIQTIDYVQRLAVQWTFDPFAAEVKKYFQPCVNTLRAHYEFTTRKRHEGEKVADYLCALRAVLVDCHITSPDEQ